MAWNLSRPSILQAVELCDLFYFITIQSTVKACTLSQICCQLLGTRQEIEDSVFFSSRFELSE